MPIHRQLEKLVRGWAKDLQSIAHEEAFEAAMFDPSKVATSISAKLATCSPDWFLFKSSTGSAVELIGGSQVEASILSACAEHRMISLVDPLTGAGLTIDISDEGEALPTIQVAGWGAHSNLLSELSHIFTEVHWLPSGTRAGR